LAKKKQSPKTEHETLRDTIENTLKTEAPKTVAELFTLVQKVKPSISREEFAEALSQLKSDAKIWLDPPPPQVKSFREYLRLTEPNAWFNFTLLTCMLTLVAIYIIPSTYPLVILRWVVGSIFVLFLPGYSSVQALFPSNRDLDDIERIALSIGLSLAITPLIGLLLNYLPWGIRLNPLVASLSLYSGGIGVIGSYRRYREAIRKTKTA